MAGDKRFFGPLLSSAQHKSVFAGDNENKRMNLVRHKIVMVRKAWQNIRDYQALLEGVRKVVKPETQPKSIREPVQRLLQGFRDYADMGITRPEKVAVDQYDALELYCSKEGYDYLYRIISETLRLEDLPDDLLLTAVTLVEFLTIDLYNLRLTHIGDPRYANFQGITYRGLRVDSKTIEEYQEIERRDDLRKRGFAIPLAAISSSTDESVMMKFAQGDSDKDYGKESRQMHWKIHIHGIDPVLHQHYLHKYPESVVTSICSLPVAPVSPFGEKEILLRGAFFQMLGMRLEEVDGREVHKLEVMMINANRDHTTELGSNEYEKRKQRDAFRRIAMASKYEVCASLASQYSALDAEQYKMLQQETLRELRDVDEISVGQLSNLADARSDEIPAWLGGTMSKSFPRHYAALRREFQEAISKGQWEEAENVLEREYDWQRGSWYSLAKLSDGRNILKPSYTLLHELATRDPPRKEDEASYMAWKRLLDGATATDVWKTLRTFDESHRTAQELAQEQGFDWLTSFLTPVIRTEVPTNIIDNLETQLHQIMRTKAGKLIDEHAFLMPQLSVLTEMAKPRLWIPVPHMYGGFSVGLVDQALHVEVIETIVGHVQPRVTKVILSEKDIAHAEEGQRG